MSIDNRPHTRTIQLLKPGLITVNVVACLVFFVILTWGICTTIRQGFPTISRMLNDSENLTIFFIVGISMYGPWRTILTLLYLLLVPHMSRTYKGFIIAFGFSEILCLILVGFFRLDDNYTAHIIVTALSVACAVLRETLLLFFRLFLHRFMGLVMPNDPTKTLPRDAWTNAVLFVNFFFLCLLIACAISFFVLEWIETESLFSAAFEYILFWSLNSLPMFQINDVIRIAHVFMSVSPPIDPVLFKVTQGFSLKRR